MEWCRDEWRSGMGCRMSRMAGVEWSGVEWSGVEWSGAKEWSGVEWRR